MLLYTVATTSISQAKKKYVGFRFPDPTELLDVEIPTLNFFIGSCL
jgi:hypothetical protein